LSTFEESCQILAVLFLDCPEEVCCKRILVRMQTSGRVDDNQDSLKKRFVTFQEETIPNLNNLKEVTSVLSVNADRSRDEIFEDISQLFDKILV
jgi:UMP-CMP kinase